MKYKAVKIGLTSLVLALTFGGLLYTTMSPCTRQAAWTARADDVCSACASSVTTSRMHRAAGPRRPSFPAWPSSWRRARRWSTHCSRSCWADPGAVAERVFIGCVAPGKDWQRGTHPARTHHRSNGGCVRGILPLRQNSRPCDWLAIPMGLHWDEAIVDAPSGQLRIARHLFNRCCISRSTKRLRSSR